MLSRRVISGRNKGDIVGMWSQCLGEEGEIGTVLKSRLHAFTKGHIRAKHREYVVPL